MLGINTTKRKRLILLIMMNPEFHRSEVTIVRVVGMNRRADISGNRFKIYLP